MTEIFGVSMTAVMFGLLALLAVALVAVALVALRNRILFEIGLRNIPRRRAQSTLIIVGLMLSTVIVSAALSTGDTVNYSITNETYDKLGHVDVLVQVRDNRDESSLDEEQIAPSGLVRGPIVADLFARLNGVEEVDGVLPVLRFALPAESRGSEVSVPQLVVVGVQESAIAGFENDIVAISGAPIDMNTLGRSDIVLNESAAAALQLAPGFRVDLYAGRVPRTFNVVAVAKDKFLTGWTQGQPNGAVVRLEAAQFLANANGVGFVAISNRGGVRDSVGLTDSVAGPLETEYAATPYEINRIKQDRVERAEDVGADMTAIFIVLGLFSIAAGMLLVFLIMAMLAAERRTEMGMSRAIGTKRLQLIETFMAEGMAYSVTAAAIGALLGVIVSLAMTRVMAHIFDAFDVGIVFHVTWRSIVIAYCLGVVLTFATVTVSAWRVSRLSVVAAIRDTNEAPARATSWFSGALGGTMVIAGAALTLYALTRDTAWAFGAGCSLIAIGIAFVARALGRPERLVFTATSIVVLVLWALIAGETLRDITGPLDSGIETFFVAGVLMVAAATFLIVYNAELLLGTLRGVGFVFGRAVPAVRTSIAYPLANRFRTGMTIAMLSLVVFALVLISTLSLNFRNLFLGDDSDGGWEIEVTENPRNPFTDAAGNELGVLGEALDRALYNTRQIESIARVQVGNPRTTLLAEIGPEGEFLEEHTFPVVAVDDTFITENEIGLQAHAKGYGPTDREVWQALLDDPANAIIDGTVVPGINYANVTEGRFTLSDYTSGEREFEAFTMRVRDTGGGSRPIRIIGIMNRAPSETYRGMYISELSFDFGITPLFSRYYVRTVPGVDASEQARAIEAALASEGVRAASIQERVEDDQQLSAAFFYLVQGFMALGLVVGLAALGVIAFRTVVERRQQIGLMRAIGFSRANVQLSFILESAFIAVLGIANGTVLALLLANRILQSEQFSAAGFTTFEVPWLQIGAMAGLVFLASVLTTIIPSRQASSLPIAEALRYE